MTSKMSFSCPKAKYNGFHVYRLIIHEVIRIIYLVLLCSSVTISITTAASMYQSGSNGNDLLRAQYASNIDDLVGFYRKELAWILPHSYGMHSAHEIPII